MGAAAFCFKDINVYNFLAYEIKHLAQIDHNSFYDESYRRTLKKPEGYADDVEEFLRVHFCLQQRDKLLRQGVPRETWEELKNWAHYGSFFHMFEMILRVSRVLDWRKLLESAYVSHLARKGFESLNDNVEETGFLVLPRVGTMNDSLTPYEDGVEEAHAPPKKKWADEHLRGINMDLANIYYVEAGDLTLDERPCKIKHYILPDLFSLKRGKPLIVGISPVVSADLLDHSEYVREEDDKLQGFFSVTGIKDPVLIQDKIRAAFMAACKENTDILIFPEMLGFEELLSDEFFDSLLEMAHREDLCAPLLTLLPTWWHEGQNELTVRDGSGKLICTQPKLTPFVLTREGVSYAEDLKVNEAIVNVVHVPAIGRLVFPICKDLLSPGYVELTTKILKATAFLCPSYSPAKTQFDYKAMEPICYGCYTAWTNTCAAGAAEGRLFEHIGLVAGPQADGKACELLRPKCGGNCGANHDACLFLTKIKIDQYAEITHEHVFPGR